MIMIILDGTVVNVAIGAVIPLAGWMMDRFDSKQVFLATLTMFILCSMLCSVAQSTSQLIIFRVIQGVGGGIVAQ